ncbi:membrane metalloprotease ARASP, chloroplastic-like [Carya illinoinensis]|uniref:membrane metalloprotease ARASP, chloroplastic-like n=1 Tax=Carya illinoinensis TaxID=32201 RepID=UPI001C71A924|nr:membrane metalloprotease ARASP, chloroplastic-like [Carya illinoinensis]
MRGSTSPIIPPQTHGLSIPPSYAVHSSRISPDLSLLNAPLVNQETMVINLSSYPPSSSYPLIRLTNSKLPISGFSLMPKTPKTQYPNSSFSFCYSFSPSRLALNFSNQFFLEKSRNPLGKRSDFRSWAISVFDVGDFENAQSVLESAAVLTAVISVHESGHFRAAYLQGIHASKFAVGFGPTLAKFNANNV